jgi:20S proteasome subunit beta 6
MMFKNQDLVGGESHPRTQLSLEKVLHLVMDAFVAAAERHIEVGDALEIYMIDNVGVRQGSLDLRGD